MKHFLMLALILTPLSTMAAFDAYIKIDGVDGESTSAAPASGTATITNVVSVTLSGAVGSTFTLDASRSIDDGTIGTFRWTQVSGPVVKIANATAPVASVVPTQAGTYVFELSVSDATGSAKVKQKTTVTVTTSKSTPVGTYSTQTGTEPQEGRTDALLEIDTIKGESTEAKKGNVEVNWKVEEGEKNTVPGVEPDEIDVAGDDEPITPDFGILLGGGSDDDDAESNAPAATEEGRAEVAKIILADLKASGVPVQSVLINTEKVETKVEHRVKLFAIIPIDTTATVEIDADEKVKVKFPWWSFLASGKDKKGVGERTFTAISNVLKTKHDTVKNSIGNIR